jgi:hypothetical protein
MGDLMKENKRYLWGMVHIDQNGKPPKTKVGDYFVESDEGEIKKYKPNLLLETLKNGLPLKQLPQQ